MSFTKNKNKIKPIVQFKNSTYLLTFKKIQCAYFNNLNLNLRVYFQSFTSKFNKKLILQFGPCASSIKKLSSPCHKNLNLKPWV